MSSKEAKKETQDSQTLATVTIRLSAGFLILPQLSFLFKSNVIGTISIFDDFFSIWHLD